MLISEVVIKLNTMLEEYGDLPVYSAELWGGSYGEVEEIKFSDHSAYSSKNCHSSLLTSRINIFSRES